MKSYIETIIAPKLQGDGGWIEYVSHEEGKLNVILRGECSKCNIAKRCMDWVEGEIQKDLGETVEIKAIRKKPFFWDNSF